MHNETFGAQRSLSNIPRPPSSRIRTPFWTANQQQNALSSLVAGGSAGFEDQQEQEQQSPSFRQKGYSPCSSNSNSGRASQQQKFSSDHLTRKTPSTSRAASGGGGHHRPTSAFRAQSVPFVPDPMRATPTVPKACDASQDIMGHRSASEYVKTELDTFEALKRRHLAYTLQSDSKHPDLEVQEQKLKKDKFSAHARDKEKIRENSGRRNQKISDGYVNFRGRTYLRYLVPLESTMTKTMRWLWDLRELNLHPVTRMMREHNVTVDLLCSEYLRVNIGVNKEAGTSIVGENWARFIQDVLLKNVYVTTVQCLSWFDLICDKKGTSLDFAAAMTKLSLVLPPEIDDSISAWFTRMFFSGAYMMFRPNDNATPSEFYYIVDALETLVDSSLKRGSIVHKLRDTPTSRASSSSSSSAGGGNSSSAAATPNQPQQQQQQSTYSPAQVHQQLLKRGGNDEFSTNHPQGIMRLLGVVRADIEAYANTISTRAVRRVDDVLSMFTPESTLPRLMKSGEYPASIQRYHTSAVRKVQLAKANRERMMYRSKSSVWSRKEYDDEVTSNNNSLVNTSGAALSDGGDDFFFSS